jgi:hypothetical protein
MVLCVTAAPVCARAQPRVEIGGFLGAVDFRESLGEKPFALGLRGGYRFAPELGVEVEMTNCPENPSGNFGQLLVMAGPKAGITIGGVNLLARAQGGIVRLGGRSFRALNRARTEPVLEVGGIAEIVYSPRFALRVDVSDAIVWFGSEPFGSPLPRYQGALGTRHTLRMSIGVTFRL